MSVRHEKITRFGGVLLLLYLLPLLAGSGFVAATHCQERSQQSALVSGLLQQQVVFAVTAKPQSSPDYFADLHSWLLPSVVSVAGHDNLRVFIPLSARENSAPCPFLSFSPVRAPPSLFNS